VTEAGVSGALKISLSGRRTPAKAIRARHRFRPTAAIPVGRNGFRLAIAAAVVYDPLNQTGSGLIVNVPLTFEFNKDFRVNLNFGGQYYSGGVISEVFRSHAKRIPA
jgi:hypothetical protein